MVLVLPRGSRRKFSTGRCRRQLSTGAGTGTSRAEVPCTGAAGRRGGCEESSIVVEVLLALRWRDHGRLLGCRLWVV